MKLLIERATTHPSLFGLSRMNSIAALTICKSVARYLGSWCNSKGRFVLDLDGGSIGAACCWAASPKVGAVRLSPAGMPCVVAGGSIESSSLPGATSNAKASPEGMRSGSDAIPVVKHEIGAMKIVSEKL